MKGRIRIGASIFQDHHLGEWPQCVPPASEYEGEEYCFIAKDPDMVFDIERTETTFIWECTADGYGSLDKERGHSYGNGSVYVQREDDVEFIDIEGE